MIQASTVCIEKLRESEKSTTDVLLIEVQYDVLLRGSV